MKYFGQPNLHIIDYKRSKEVFVFDDKGEFETDDPKLIEWMRKNKGFIRCEESEQYQCKKCDYTTDNKGELMAHYRTEHPKQK